VTTDVRWDPEAARRRIGAVVPSEAVRHGWNVRNLTFEQDATARERWAVEAVGPMETSVRYVEFIGGHSAPLIEVGNGVHGVLEARTLDDLEFVVRAWVLSVWGDR
jgi:hypothetical protein